MLQIEHRVLGVLKNLLLPGWAAGSQKRLKSDVELGPFERAWSGSVRLPALLRLKKCFVQNWNSPDPNFYSFHITQVMPGEMRQCKIRSSLERIKQIWGVLPWSSQWLENRPGWLVIAKGEFIGISSPGHEPCRSQCQYFHHFHLSISLMFIWIGQPTRDTKNRATKTSWAWVHVIYGTAMNPENLSCISAFQSVLSPP